MSFESIDIDQAQQLIKDQNATVIDVRDQASFELGHIENSIHVSNDSVEAFILNADLSKPLIVCCYHGNMSKGAADYFNSRGFEMAYSLNGGYAQWAIQAQT